MSLLSAFSLSPGRRWRPGLLIATALSLSASALQAQWSGSPKFNNFVGGNAPPVQSYFNGILALRPVMTPCNNGCFYAWINSNGDVNIQIIDNCGNPVLGTPYLIQHGFCPGSLPFPLPAQIAGCEFDDPSTTAHEQNQMFLAYTQCNGGTEELRCNVFTFDPADPRKIVPGTPLLLHTCANATSLVTPSADSSVDTTGAIDGAVVGWREWDFITGTVTLGYDKVVGSAAFPASSAWTITYSEAFAPADNPPRLSVLSDHQGGLFGGWRGINSNPGPTYCYMGTHLDSAGALVFGWPTTHTAWPTARTQDDWVSGSDLVGGAFTAVVDDAGNNIVIRHVDSAGTFSTLPRLFSNFSNNNVELFGIVGLASSGGPGTTRAAFAYREGLDVKLTELTHGPLATATVGPGRSALLSSFNSVQGPVAGGCVARTHRGVAVGWLEGMGRGNGLVELYGEEVDVDATGNSWPMKWRGNRPGARKLISRNESSVSGQLGRKFYPMVVRKHTLPEVIFGWIDTRGPENDLMTPGHRGATTPGAYVQSVADDFLTYVWTGGLWGSFQRRDGILGSNVMCWTIRPFDVTGITVFTGKPSGPPDPFGTELYAFSRETGTPELLFDINPGPASSNPTTPIRLGSRYVFAATTAAGGTEPWVTDGTAAGTMQLADCEPGPGSSSPSLGILGMMQDGVEIFSVSTAATGRELWRTDGTPAGTSMIVDLRPGSASGVTSTVVAVSNGFLYFWGNDGVSGTELWRTDGTAAGTAMVADMSPGSASTGVGAMAAVPGFGLVFIATVAGLGAEPYWIDPFTGTPTLIGDLAPGAASSSPQNLTAAGPDIYFSANTAIGREPWLTIGGGLQQLGDLNPSGSSNPANFTAVGSYVLFTADNGTNGIELWRTDGTPAGTVMVADIAPGNASSSPSALTPLENGYCVFTATDGSSGREPWITDGTAAGTMRLADLNPGSAGSNPQRYDVVAGEIWFDALIEGEQTTVHLPIDAPARLGHGCRGQLGEPRIGAPSGPPQLGQTFTVTLSNGAPNSIAALVYNTTSTPVTIGDCTILVDLPELGMLLTFTDGGGNASVAIPIPNRPDLIDQTFFLQWAVIDPTGALLSTFALSDALQVTVQ